MKGKRMEREDMIKQIAEMIGGISYRNIRFIYIFTKKVFEHEQDKGMQVDIKK